MKKFFAFCRYSHRNFCFIIKLLLAWFINKISLIVKWHGSSFAENLLCKNPFIFYTPFWNYLMESLEHYYMCNEDFESEIWKIIKNIPQNNNKEKYLINIWSNIGRWAIDLAKNYNYNVIAFEPTPSTYRNLMINTYLSNLSDKITSYNIWLWDKDNDMFFEVWSACDSTAHIVSKKTSNTIIIPVKKFDNLWISHEIINNTRLIIMDVEWFEYNVLKWMRNALNSMNKETILIIEILRDSKNKEKTFSYMGELWFHYKTIDDDNYLFQK